MRRRLANQRIPKMASDPGGRSSPARNMVLTWSNLVGGTGIEPVASSRVSEANGVAGRCSVCSVLQLSRADMAPHSPDAARVGSCLALADSEIDCRSSCVSCRMPSAVGTGSAWASSIRPLTSLCRRHAEPQTLLPGFPHGVTEQGQRLASGLIQRSLPARPSGLSRRMLAIRSASIVVAARVRACAEGSRISPPWTRPWASH